jgi:hypothetical protein
LLNDGGIGYELQSTGFGHPRCLSPQPLYAIIPSLDSALR